MRTLLRSGGDKVRLLFEPRDCWVGVYWRKSAGWNGPLKHWKVDLFLCLLPCLPLVFTWYRPRYSGSDRC